MSPFNLGRQFCHLQPPHCFFLVHILYFSERLTSLFVKITNQMIGCCKAFIRKGPAGGKDISLWEQDKVELVEKFHMCIDLFEKYKMQYSHTKVCLDIVVSVPPFLVPSRFTPAATIPPSFCGSFPFSQYELQQNPTGKQFDCSEAAIFGKFDVFCRRLHKLIDIFGTSLQVGFLSMGFPIPPPHEYRRAGRVYPS